MATTINLGKIRPYDAGEWSATYAGGYDVLNIVTYNGGSFMSKVTANTYPLTDRTKWIPLTDGEKIIDDEEVIATDLNELSARVSALEAAFRNMIISKMQIDSIDVLKDLNYQGRPLFIVSDVAPNIVPDGVPQFWINTANGDFYSAKNNTSVNDWILK
jgi:hypothetical protein